MSDRVETVMKFGYGKMMPVGFVWRGREYRNFKVTIVFERRDGDKKQVCFGVDTGGMTAELIWDLQSFQFSIHNIQPVW